MQKQILRTLALRLGIPVLAVWLVAAFFNAVWAYALAGVLTLAVGGVVYWGWSRTQKTRKVADILQSTQVTDKGSRQAAVEKLESEFKKGDLAATMAKAQLLIQDDPEKAQAELESIDLSQALPIEADQVRFQRAMIHLTKGEVDRARALVDLIDLAKQEDAKGRALMGAVIAEAWARTGQAKKGLEILDRYKDDDPVIAEIRPQLWRARAFAAVALNDSKMMRRALQQLNGENPQYLAAFLQKKIHPLLVQEAKQILTRSGAIPRSRPQYRAR